MCGIAAFIGRRNAASILMRALKLLESRGYDSGGMALHTKNGLVFCKRLGKLSVLSKAVEDQNFVGTCGIGHNRWATHGAPSEVNAHPHFSRNGKIAVVHNGIIENFRDLRDELTEEGFTFVSETDTEVIPNLIEREFLRGAESLEMAVEHALKYLRGAYGIAVLSADHPDEIVGARHGSPLIVGVGDGELFLASDRSALVEHVEHVAVVPKNHIVVLPRNGPFRQRGINGEKCKPPCIKKIGVGKANVSKGSHKHYMLKEILEQSEVLAETLRGRLAASGRVKLGGFTSEVISNLQQTHARITLLGCGTSYFAGLVGKLLIEKLARVPVETALASAFRYRNPILGPDDFVGGISQSGETKDLLGALELAEQRGAIRYGITNGVDSAITDLTPSGTYLHVGSERSVASTKAFTGQVTVLMLMALRIAALRGQDSDDTHRIAQWLRRLPRLMTQSLERLSDIQACAERNAHAKRMFFLGRNFCEPLAYEAALKMKEVAYIDAVGYEASELKHGAIALIEKGTPVVAFLPQDGLEEKMLSNLKEVAARGAKPIIFSCSEAIDLRSEGWDVVQFPPCPEELSPLVLAPAAQLFAYYVADKLENDVDQPRHLAKVVTVE